MDNKKERLSSPRSPGNASSVRRLRRSRPGDDPAELRKPASEELDSRGERKKEAATGRPPNERRGNKETRRLERRGEPPRRRRREEGTMPGEDGEQIEKGGRESRREGGEVARREREQGAEDRSGRTRQERHKQSIEIPRP